MRPSQAETNEGGRMEIRTNNGSVKIEAGPSGHGYFKGSVEISAKGHTVEIVYFPTIEEAVQHAAAMVSDEVEYPETGIDYNKLGQAEAAHAASQFHQ